MKAKINGIGMNYAVSGADQAPAVLLHHPLGTNLATWDELTAALEPNYRVVRFDARGHGETDAPPGPYDFQTLAADAIGLLDHLRIERTRYLGLSMGGFLGQVLGLGHAHRFHSLCLVSTSSDMTGGGREIWDQRIAAVSKDGMTKAIIDQATTRWVAPEALTSKPAVVARLRRMLETTPPNGYVGWSWAIRDFNVTSRISAIELPVKVIVGALDPATPPAGAKVIHRAIAGSEYAEVAGTSHMLHVEEPARFHAEVLPFMAKHGPAA